MGTDYGLILYLLGMVIGLLVVIVWVVVKMKDVEGKIDVLTAQIKELRCDIKDTYNLEVDILNRKKEGIERLVSCINTIERMSEDDDDAADDE